MSGFLFLQIYALFIPLVLAFRYYWVRQDYRRLPVGARPDLSKQELAFLSCGAHHVVLIELCDLVAGNYIDVDAEGVIRRGNAQMVRDEVSTLQSEIYDFIQARSQAVFSDLIGICDRSIKQVEQGLAAKSLLVSPGLMSKMEYQSWAPVLALAAVGLIRVIYAKYLGYEVGGQIGMIAVLLALSYLLGVHLTLSPMAVRILREERARARSDQTDRFRKIILTGVPLSLPRDQHPFFAACIKWRISGQYTEAVGLKRSLIRPVAAPPV